MSLSSGKERLNEANPTRAVRVSNADARATANGTDLDAEATCEEEAVDGRCRDSMALVRNTPDTLA
ncbi:uncharacterized protein FOMMEDRAFT_150075 [Fomitiporia mediterranea MF3/22]|uniref:uncharacterized protein n=1 Tax=Fomitiporia mediterranea (strain MF3/22) TaxID=694068 RepID=UPI0004408425|nr:uncharacterized protein FOMMEDRAFT_150075 [Fomitiporia mediterranea MF3/22]EJD07542.1 hypothetical protein FOMMEDRAFT_150075 [Fomitiporia mediterranea MF3/22]